MNRVQQLLTEALDEVEKYGSLLSMYILVKKLALDYSSIVRQEEIKYDITVDDIILLSLSQGEVGKVPLFSISFLIYDYLSSFYSVQDCLFYFRWDKRIFVYSPRVESHLHYLIRTGYVNGIKYFRLTEKGKSEVNSKIASLTEKERKDIINIVNTIRHKKRNSEIKKYIRERLFGK